MGRREFFKLIKVFEEKAYERGNRDGVLSGYNAGRRDGRNAVRSNY